MTTSTVQAVAQNETLMAVARVSMALALPLVTGISTLGGMWLSSRFEIQDARFTAIQTQVVTIENSLNARVAATERGVSSVVDQIHQINNKLTQVETRQTQEAAASERFQRDMANRLDKLQDSISEMSTAMAGLAAAFRIQEETRRRESPRD